ncbi:MAG: hypothetical protein WCF57_05275 [Pyrinomonadaceae bacterium]
MTAQPHFLPRFVRKTQLATNEYHKNFFKIDREVIAAVTSVEADKATPLMSKIYLRLVNAPAEYWEREGVLRFEAECREGKQLKAWVVLCELLGVASATASKALSWMHDQGIIGYFAGKNGVGIRIFLNRAANSIGHRTSSNGKKILEFAPASSGERRASPNEAAFNDSFAVLEVLDSEIDPRAPDGDADKETVDKKSPNPTDHNPRIVSGPRIKSSGVAGVNLPCAITVDEIVRRLKSELEPSLEATARAAATREHERTREWLETRGLPKAARVAQREAYNVLRSHGVISAAKERTRAELEVGRSHQIVEAKPLNADEIKEMAEMCVAMFETHGQGVDVTLSEISSEAGGFLLVEDAPRVRALAESMIQEIGGKGH